MAICTFCHPELVEGSLKSLHRYFGRHDFDDRFNIDYPPKKVLGG